MPHTPKPPQETPGASEKAMTRVRLVSKGVPANEADRLAGVGESLTRLQIAQRRIEWQRGLPRG